MNILNLSLFLAALICCQIYPIEAIRKLVEKKTLHRRLHIKANYELVQPKYFDQCSQVLYFDENIDHYNFDLNIKTYPMRYILYDKFWSKGNPIFFYTGNEGDIVWFCQNTGFMWHLAEELSALVVFAEHRYYGESNPFGNQSFSTPAIDFLTSEQALADYSYLIKYLQTVYGEVPVIAFGGSYGGMLASWMRMKYPNVITGALAASAPIFQFTINCDSFSNATTNSFYKADPKCPSIIRSSWDAINQLAKTKLGLKQLTNIFKLCKPLKVPSDGELVKDWLNEMYGDIAMSNYPYPTYFLNPLPAWPVKAICSKISNAFEKYQDEESNDPVKILEAIYQGANVYMNYTGNASCFDIDDTDGTEINMVSWDYQTCTEFPFPMCSNGVDDMYEPQTWDYNKYSQVCFDALNVRPRSEWAVNYYGASIDDIKSYSNIIFSNGELDPWAPGGVLVPVNDKIQTILIENGAHHLDLREPNPADPQSVILARQKEKETIMTWIKEYNDQRMRAKDIL